MESSESKYKHKPSEKHTLEEVLKSLQDLIRVDLSEDKSTTGKTEKPDTPARAGAEAKPNREKPSNQREDFTPATPGAGPVNLDAVMRSLRDLITNELDVGHEPKPEKAKPPTTHDEYLKTEENIEEYIPEELSSLNETLDIRDEPKVEALEAAPPPEDAPATDTIENIPAPDELTPSEEDSNLETPVTDEAAPAPEAESIELSEEIPPEPQALPEASESEEFITLDEELTFEAEAAAEPPPAAPAPSLELPGEIAPELLDEPPSASPGEKAASPKPEKELASGEQHEMTFEEAPTSTPEPQPLAVDSAPASPPEPEPVPEPPQEADKPPVEAKQEEPAEALPTIDVEESYDDNDYFSDAPPDANASAASEENIDLNAEISPEAKNDIARSDEKIPAPEPVAPPETPVTPDAKKTKLEIVETSLPKKTDEKYTVDFDASDLSPPLPEEPQLSASEENDLSPPLPEEAELSSTDDSNLNPPLPQKPELSSSEETESTPPLPEDADVSPPVADSSETSTAPDDAEKSERAPEPEPEMKAPAPAPEVPAVEKKTETPSSPAPPKLKPKKTAKTPAPKPPATQETEDDIPVLKDVVNPQADDRASAETAARPLPAPDRAREIVVRAVAKLNVEMRKSGSAGLDTRTILRLQQLIRQELEKGDKK